MGELTCSFGWGLDAALDVMARHSCARLAIVDVLSFSTTVSIAAARGIEIIPAAPADADRLAAIRAAAVASPSREHSPGAPWTLSPSRMATAPFVPTLVLTSVNGSAISSAVATGSPEPVSIVAACLRNCSAAARWMASPRSAGDRRSALAVIAAGERWSGDGLRVAVEDLVAAALLLSRLAELGVSLSPEAAIVARCTQAMSAGEIGDAVRQSLSADELRARGYGEDVELASEVDASTVVPVLSEGSGFVAVNPPLEIAD